MVVKKSTNRHVHVMRDLYVACVLAFLYSNTLFSLCHFLASESNMPTDLEIRRQENIARNRERLRLLNLTGPSNKVKQITQRNPGHKSTPQKRTAPPKKRVPPPASDGETEGLRPTKRPRSETPQSDLRRSSRNAGKAPPDYQAESQTQLPRLVARKIGPDHDRDPNRRSGKRIHDPYD